VNWGRNTGVDGTTNVANLDRVDQTLDRTQHTAGPPSPRQLPGLRQLTPEVLRYIMATTRDTGGNDQKGVSANISGELFALPAGPVGFAAVPRCARKVAGATPTT
jgi:hypothetical protein